MVEVMPQFSIVTPVYRSSESLVTLYERIQKTMDEFISEEFELIMVNDASPGNDWEIIRTLADRDARVKGINLSRNFGQYYALTAGLDQARGEWIIILDCDLQDQPEEIPQLFAKACEGYDIVLAQRIERQDSWFKRFCSKSFYTVFSYLTDTKQDPSTAQFGIYHRKVVNTLIEMRERLRFLPAFIQWVGFRSTAIPVAHGARDHSPSSYSFRRLLALALDTMIAFSDKPLRLIVRLGFIITSLSFLAGIFFFIETLAEGTNIDPATKGWPSLMISLCFFSGLIISLLGINGIYISKIYDEVKKRPLYIVQEIYQRGGA